jgi:GGDEF domain-containing protein
LPLWTNKTLKTLAPGGALVLCVAILNALGWLRLPQSSLSFLYYSALIGGMLLAWRFRSSRVFFALLVLFLSQQALAAFGGNLHSAGPPGRTALETVAILLPLNFVLVSLMRERGFALSSATPAILVLFVESIVLIVLSRSAETGTLQRAHAQHHPAPLTLPQYALWIFLIAGSLLFARFLISHKPADSALLWSAIASFLSLSSIESTRNFTLYMSTAALILGASVVESSYLLAYHDELTSLPSRRAFNDAILRLRDPYSIAVVDIDHFKKFNDTYGHDTGDQVLRLVATRLAQVTGGGQAFRCGGEEFTILFSGKTTPQVVEHLERLRLAIESSSFRTRGLDRRQSPRGPERRNHRTTLRPKGKGQAIRQLAEPKTDHSLSVTVSIGVATSEPGRPDPAIVVESADKALYRAKANGRNRLETASPKRRPRSKAAGIA